MFKRKSLVCKSVLRSSESTMSRLMFKPSLGQEFEFKVNLLIVLALGWPWHPSTCLSWVRPS